jgi:hypothetical protein
MENSNLKIPKRKKLFENFSIFGIENENLEYIKEGNLFLTPKILFSYPEDKSYNILLNYYQNCCYKNGVNVIRKEIYTEIDYSIQILEQNFFTKPISTFIFMKASDGIKSEKYIYGIKFMDIHVFQEKIKSKTNCASIYKYEKCYLFLSNEPCFQLLEILCYYFLYIKKLNYLNNLSEFSCIFKQEQFDNFNLYNSEKNNPTIKNILEKIFNNSYSKSSNIIKEQLLLTSNMKNKTFLSWLFEKIIWNYNADIIFKILIMIFFEQQILFYGNNLQLITFSCLFFSKVIKPFIWKYPLIPNLPLFDITMLASPTPFIIGILTNENDLKDINKETCNMIKIENENIEIINLINKNFDFDNCLFFLKYNIERIFWEVENINPKIDDYEKISKISDFFSSKINEGIERSIISQIDSLIDICGEKNIKKMKKFIDINISSKSEQIFFKELFDTEMFYSYINDNKDEK